MKNIFAAFVLFIAVVGCRKAPSTVATAEVPTASFKNGHGVSIPGPMRKSLGIKVADVTEQKITPRMHVPLHVVRGMGDKTSEAEGWLTEEQAKAIRPGLAAKILLADGKTESGTVRRIELSPYSGAGDFEIMVHVAAPLEAGTPLTAVIETPATGDVVAVPRSAIIKTAEGEFVYTVNEEYFARARVKTGAQNDEFSEITDGLYAGDQIVVAEVMPLWMTELQSLRAGQACCKGH